MIGNIKIKEINWIGIKEKLHIADSENKEIELK